MESSEAARRFTEVRGATEQLCRPLATEDYVLQSMPDASPAKWHLAHTTWFFETFLLLPRGEAPFHPRYGYLFNSYYNAVGERHARPQRGMLSRPTVEEVYLYRADVDARVRACLDGGALSAEALAVLEKNRFDFVVGSYFFREPFDTTQLVGFALIWLALAVYSADMVRAGRRTARRAR